MGTSIGWGNWGVVWCSVWCRLDNGSDPCNECTSPRGIDPLTGQSHSPVIPKQRRAHTALTAKPRKVGEPTQGGDESKKEDSKRRGEEEKECQSGCDIRNLEEQSQVAMSLPKGSPVTTGREVVMGGRVAHS